MTAPAQQNESGRRGPARGIFLALIVLCAVLGLIDVVNLALHWIHHHPYFSAEHIPNFYGFFGLAGCVFVAVISRWLRRALMRDEDYYDDDVD